MVINLISFGCVLLLDHLDTDKNICSVLLNRCIKYHIGFIFYVKFLRPFDQFRLDMSNRLPNAVKYQGTFAGGHVKLSFVKII